MNIESIQKLVIAAVGVLLLAVVLFLTLPALMRGKGNITIQTAPSGAQVILDGKTYESPAKLTSIRTGGHKVEVSMKGFKSRVDEVLVERGKSTKVTLRLYSSEVNPTVVRANLDEVSKLRSDLEKIAGFLPFANEKYKIEIKTSLRKPLVEITLYAILNKPSQYKAFKEQIKSYSKEALDWIRSKGADPNNLDIHWEPVDPNKI